MNSLQTRISTAIGLFLAVVVGLMLTLGGYSLGRLLEQFSIERLEHDMEALLTALTFDPAGQPQLDPVRINPIFQQPYSGHYYRITATGQALYSRSLWDADLTLPVTGAPGLSHGFTAGPQGQELLAVTRTFTLQGRPVTVTVTEDFSRLVAGLRQLLWLLVGLSLALLAGLILAQRWLVRRTLTPLEQTRLDLKRLQRGEIASLDPPRVPREVRPLVEEVNRLAGLTEQRLGRSRRALGNLAHALKTPLTVLTHLAEQPETQAQPALRQELDRQTRILRRLIDRELKRARIAGAATPGRRVDLAREAGDLVDTLQRIYRDRSLTFRVDIPPGSPFPGDRDDLLELLGNLLDNACQWTAGSISLTARETAHRLEIRVEDDGPGCDDEQRAELVRRGVRVDESRAGHGLGLAIVADIVEQYGGRLDLGRSRQLGGFQARVELPN